MAGPGSRSKPRKRARAKPALTGYRAKRDFATTPEPEGAPASQPGDRFVVQKHAARRLHYDLRLELGGTLKCWAVTKGPSLDPKVRRLAVHVEDHPLEYTDFEGTIPDGAYGAGAMIVWDRGTWVPMGDAEKGYREGQLKFRLVGEKLRGGWTLVQLKSGKDANGKNWLFIKERDTYARPEADGDILTQAPLSVVSGRAVEDLAPAPESKARRKPRRRKKVHPERLAGAREAALPAKPRPQLATLAAQPPAGEDWIHEIKLDGYRTLARIEDGLVRLLTRNGHDWTDRYRALAVALGGLACRAALIDGEVCVQTSGGATSFAALQDALAAGAEERLIYFAFDLMYLDGFDLSRTPLIERKRALAALIDPIAGETSPVQLSDHFAGDGAAFFAEAARLSLEGVVSKKADAPYAPGRSRTWVKTKCVAAGTFRIVGYTESAAAGGLSALLLAEPAGGGLKYVGKVGTGFSGLEAKSLGETLAKLRADAAPLSPAPKVPKARWVRPDLSAEIHYRARTGTGALRAAAYKGLAPDAAAPPAPPQSRYVRDADLAEVWVTNPDRPMFGPSGPRKLDLVLYYAEVGERMMPELVKRPLTLVRCPSGSAAECFYQRHAGAGMPPEIRRVPLREEGSKKRADYLYIDGAKGLFSLAQFGVVEFHPWGCRTDKPERPDRLIFDIDPDEGLDWRAVVDAAFEIGDRLAHAGLAAFVRTTGGKGLHVVVPVERRHSWSELKDFSHGFVAMLERRAPGRFTASMSRTARRGRMFVDYLRNQRGATAVASYSLRARPGAPAATPVEWDELRDIEDPRELDYATVTERLARADPWRNLENSARRLTKAIERKLGINK